MKSALAPQPSRRVRHLRVRGEREDEVRHAAIVLADALHTASMPVAERGQMLLVRKLELGRISPRASAATLALLVERALRAVQMAAVPFDLPAATSANAVLIPGHAEAIARLARLHARGIEAREWFWEAAVPGWRAGLSREQKWVALLEAAHALPEVRLVAAAVVQEAVRAGIEDELRDAIPLPHIRHWLRVEEWITAPVAETRPTESLLTPRHGAIVERWQGRGASEEFLTWIVLMLAVAERPARAADARLPARAAAWLRSNAERTDNPPPAEAKAPGAPARAADDSEPAGSSFEPAIADPALIEREAARASEQVVRSEIDEGAELADNAPAAFAEDELMAGPPAANRAAALFGEPTRFAGLLFLVPVLERLGFAEFLEMHPSLVESNFPARLLLFIGARTGMKPRDPMSLALGEAEPFEFEMLRGMPEPARALLAAPAPRARIDTPQTAWLTALRRWCRRHARIGLASLVRRPGRVAASLTHLDIFFDLAEADLRLRRMALDVDPGWVPWLGCVVRFHYLEGHDHGI